MYIFTVTDQNQHIPEPSEQRDIIPHYSIRTDEESHFFTYFTVVSLISVAAYIGYHNKQKVNDYFVYFLLESFVYSRLVNFDINVLIF